MPEMGTVILLFGAGILLLVAELFIPSYGVLSVVGCGFLIAGVAMTFRQYGEQAGVLAILVCVVAVPAFAVAAVKVWPRTWIGRRIAPPNPTSTPADTSIPITELSRYVGRTGRTLSALRPVGVCEFEGRRISCIAEYGILDAGVAVEGVRVGGGGLTVREKQA